MSRSQGGNEKRLISEGEKECSGIIAEWGPESCRVSYDHIGAHAKVFGKFIQELEGFFGGSREEGRREGQSQMSK